ncbi:MAG: hypothetical protein ACPHCI_04415 [Solirubrobacterales bacterium]
MIGSKLKLLALFVIGVGLLFPFEYTITLILGVGFLLAFVVYGMFVVAEPDFLSGESAVDFPAAEEREVTSDADTH